MKTIQTAKIIWQENFPIHERFGDIYFSKENPVQESLHTFLKGVDAYISQNKKTIIVELGFGSGLNFLTLVKLLQDQNIKNQVDFYSCEKYPLQKKDLKKIAQMFPSLALFYEKLYKQYPPLVLGWFTLTISSLVKLHLYWGDVQDFVKQLACQKADFVFLDGHAPAQNPQMWNALLLKSLADKIKINGIVKSFSVAGSLRRTLQQHGFLVKKISGIGKKRSVLFAQKIETSTCDTFDSLPWFSLLKVSGKQKNKTVAIVGAGISGSSLSYFLLKKKYNVILIDRQKEIAREASGNLAGMVHPALASEPTDLSLFSLESFYFLLNLLKTLKNVDYQFCPVEFFYDFDFARFEKFKNRFLKFSNWTHHYFQNEIFQSSIQLKDMLWLSPRSLCQALLSQHKNLQLLLNEQATSFQQENNEWVVYNEKNKKIAAADVLVLASGKSFVSTVSFLQNGDAAHHFFDESVSLKQGHVVYGQRTQDMKNQNILNSGYYFIDNISLSSSRKKYFLSGADFSEVGSSFSLEEFTASLNKTFSKYLPLEWRAQHVRCSVRCHSADRLPIAGPLPIFSFYQKHYYDLQKGRKLQHYEPANYHENVFVLSGMGSKGLLFAPYSAKLLSDVISQEYVSSAWLDKLHPARFYIRKLFKTVS